MMVLFVETKGKKKWVKMGAVVDNIEPSTRGFLESTTGVESLKIFVGPKI